MGKSLSATFRKVFPKAKSPLKEIQNTELQKTRPVRSIHEMVPINEQEFNTVSSLLRGKLTLEMVNKVYHVIFEYFEQHPKR
jgi:hypothetical protein